MDKRIYDAIQFIEVCEDENAKKHIQELLDVCKYYVKTINELEDKVRQ